MIDLSVLREALQRFWDLPFPGKCRGRDVFGIELILLDPEIYHAAERIADGDRDSSLLNQLGHFELQAQMVLHALENDAYFYYDQAR